MSQTNRPGGKTADQLLSSHKASLETRPHHTLQSPLFYHIIGQGTQRGKIVCFRPGLFIEPLFQQPFTYLQCEFFSICSSFNQHHHNGLSSTRLSIPRRAFPPSQYPWGGANSLLWACHPASLVIVITTQ